MYMRIYIYIYVYAYVRDAMNKIKNEFKYSLLLVCRRCPSVNAFFFCWGINFGLT